MGPDGERGVEHEYTLARPRTEVAVDRWRDPKIGLEFFEDVDERWRKPDAVVHAEAETVRLPWAVVRILAEKHDPDVGEGGEMQGRENLVVRRVHLVGGTLRCDEAHEFLPVRLLELGAQDGIPVGPWRHAEGP